MAYNATLASEISQYGNNLASRTELASQLQSSARQSPLTMLVGLHDSGKSTLLHRAFPDATYITASVPGMFRAVPVFGSTLTGRVNDATPLDVLPHKLKPTNSNRTLVIEEAGSFYTTTKKLGLRPREYLDRILQNWDSVVLEMHASGLDIESETFRKPRVVRDDVYWQEPTVDSLAAWCRRSYRPTQQILDRRERAFCVSTAERSRVVYNSLWSHEEVVDALQLVGFSDVDANSYASLIGGSLVPLHDTSLERDLYGRNFSNGKLAFMEYSEGKPTRLHFQSLRNQLSRQFAGGTHAQRVAYKTAFEQREQSGAVGRSLEALGVLQAGKIRSALEHATVGTALEYARREFFWGPSAADILQVRDMLPQTT